jgi:hypothetical protein
VLLVLELQEIREQLVPPALLVLPETRDLPEQLAQLVPQEIQEQALQVPLVQPEAYLALQIFMR